MVINLLYCYLLRSLTWLAVDRRRHLRRQSSSSCHLRDGFVVM